MASHHSLAYWYSVVAASALAGRLLTAAIWPFLERRIQRWLDRR